MEATLYTLQIIARLNAVTFRQMQIITERKFSRSTLFRSLSELTSTDYLVRVAHPRKKLFAYKLTPQAFPVVFGPEGYRANAPRDFDLFHTLLCTEALINLARYKNVTGFATESELSKEDLEYFCYSRRPDAVIQITKSHFVYELALEIESSRKTTDRVDELLDCYERTFDANLLCHGLILITTRPEIYELYKERIAKRPKSFDDRVLLIENTGLKGLNPEVYGHRGTDAEPKWNRIRTQFQDGVKYIPFKSDTYVFGEAFKTGISKDQSQLKS